MKRLLFFLMCPLVFCLSCKKSNPGWDTRLNGTWVEDYGGNGVVSKSLPTGCDVLFNDHFMSICNQPLSQMDSKNVLVSSNGQIYLHVQAGFKRKLEYRFDYFFDGEHLVLTEDTNEKIEFYSTQNLGSTSKRYRKL